eukprot:m.32270 g.32270  ORF g.32270 m.32270 type:complete len:911 (-) comp4879_c0_seq1:154-2886(-)
MRCSMRCLGSVSFSSNPNMPSPCERSCGDSVGNSHVVRTRIAVLWYIGLICRLHADAVWLQRGMLTRRACFFNDECRVCVHKTSLGASILNLHTSGTAWRPLKSEGHRQAVCAPMVGTTASATTRSCWSRRCPTQPPHTAALRRRHPFASPMRTVSMTQHMLWVCMAVLVTTLPRHTHTAAAATVPSRLDCDVDIDDDDNPNVVGRRLVLFFGTRPETIKMAPVLAALTGNPSKLKGIRGFKAVFTGQHPDLVKPFTKFWNIQVDAHVQGTFKASQSLPQLSAALIGQIDASVASCPGDVWLVQGDTQSAFAAGFVAFLRSIPVVHVEAGLRTFDMRSPFPEELNRRAIGMMASLHAAPTELSRQNLIGQGVDPYNIIVTGNTGIDAARLAETHIERPANLPKSLSETSRMLLVTMHRRENRAHMKTYYDTIGSVSACTDTTVVISVHPSPAAKHAAMAACETYSHFVCLPPLNYGESQWMLKYAMVVVTDSGGLQEEATWYHTPSLVLRVSTERPEAVMAGTSLIAADVHVLEGALDQLCQPPSNASALVKQMRSRHVRPFGDGFASQMIVMAAGTAPQLESIASVQETHPMRPAHSIIPRKCKTDLDTGWEACSVPGTYTMVMNAFARRALLPVQLSQAANQTVKPKDILVVQSTTKQEHKDVTDIIATFRKEHPDIPIRHVQLGANGWYHTRFFLAHAMSDAEYVAILDDDQALQPSAIESFMEQSARKNALITANGRTITGIVKAKGPLGWAPRQDPDCKYGREEVDFGGHLWVLPRDALRHFFAQPQLTRRSGEDVQLSFALRQHGIRTFCTETQSLVTDIPVSEAGGRTEVNRVSSWLHIELQFPRNLAFCELMLLPGLHWAHNKGQGFGATREEIQRCIDTQRENIRKTGKWNAFVKGTLWES